MESTSAQVRVVYPLSSVTRSVVLGPVARKPAMEMLPRQREDWLEVFAMGLDLAVPRMGVRCGGALRVQDHQVSPGQLVFAWRNACAHRQVQPFRFPSAARLLSSGGAPLL